MTGNTKRKTLILLGLMILFTAMIAAALPELELQPGMPLPRLQQGQLVAAVPTEEVQYVSISATKFMLVLVALILAGALLYTIYRVLRGADWSKDRKTWLQGLGCDEGTIVFFEAPHRIRATLTDISNLLVDRPITVARELTKLHEEIVHTTAAGAQDLKISERGEFTVVLGPRQKMIEGPQVIDDKELYGYFCQITNLGRVSRRQAVTQTALKFGLSTNDVYARLERQKASDPP